MEGTCDGAYTIVRTWTATDACGNESFATQNIIVADLTPPVIVNGPADIAVECDAIPSPINPQATDNCDANVTITMEETRTNVLCLDSYTLTRTWTATDACGNFSTYAQVITVIDTTPPGLQGIPTDITVNPNVGQNIPNVPNNITATDNCDIDVDIDFNEVQDDNGCGLVITRTWTATDNCGNTRVETQLISVSGDLTVTIMPDNSEICLGESIDFTATSDEPASTYQWSVTGGTLNLSLIHI